MMNPYGDPLDEETRRRVLGLLDTPDNERGTTAPVNTIPTPQPITQPDTTGPFQNPQGASAPGASAYAPRIVTEGGQNYLTEHGNRRPLQGQEVTDAQQYVTDFWGKYPTGFQPDAGGGQTATGAPVGAQTNAGYQKTGWAFDSPTGGRKEFSYTPQSYGDDMTGFSGFSSMGEGSSDRSSIKNIFRDAAAGLGGGEGGYTEADLDETVRRLNAMGIPAKKVDAYQIDFGTGEGPIQVRSSRNEVWWNNRATEGGGGASSGTGGAPTTAPATGNADGGGNTLAMIQQLIKELSEKGYNRDQVMSLLGQQ